MKKIDINKLDLFQLYQIKQIIEERCEHFSKSIPDYALILTDAKSMTPVQKSMLDKYNIIKIKLSKINSQIDDYLINTLMEDEKD